MERLKRFTPPGMNLSGIMSWTIGTIIVSTLFSMIFLMEYFGELNELKRNMAYPVYAGATMPLFQELVFSPMAVFRISPVVPLLYIPAFYLYFYQDTKSVYIMKRLKSPWEMHLRCLVLPVLGSLLVIAAGFAVYWIYYLIYHTFTPEVLLPSNL